MNSPKDSGHCCWLCQKEDPTRFVPSEDAGVQRTDLLGGLSAVQIDHFSAHLERAYGVALQAVDGLMRQVAGAGYYWLEHEEKGGAGLVTPRHTVEQVWGRAASLPAELDASLEGEDCPLCGAPVPSDEEPTS